MLCKHLLTLRVECFSMSRPEETRQRILASTYELISEKGYTGATTREIADRAGVSELTLFRKFGRKEKLFEEMLATFTFLPRLKDLVLELEGMPAREGLGAIGIRFLQTLQERKNLVRIMLAEINTYPEKIRTAYNQTIEEMGRTLVGYLEGLQAAGTLREVSLDTAAMVYLRVLFTSFLNREVLQGKTMSAAEMGTLVNEVVDIFLNGVLTMRDV